MKDKLTFVFNRKRLRIFILLLGTFGFTSLRAQVPEFWYDYQIKQMSLDEKIGQLFMVAAYSNKNEAHTEEIENLIRNYHIGGLIFFQDNPLKQVYLSNYFQSVSKTPLMIGIDGEWGPAMRLKNTLKFPYAITLGATNNDSLVYQVGAAIARQCKRLGIHINFAPVVDINVNPKNPIIGFRAFGDDKHLVARMGLAYSEGHVSENVLSCAKHFPGHGDVHVDSHHDLPVVDKSFAQLDSAELFPYHYMMKQGLPSLMVAHIHFPQLDSRKNRSASLSANIIDTLLRQKMKFEGLIFTDALNMKGVSKYYRAGEAELEAVLAGNDVLLFSENVPAAVEVIKQAVLSGKISEKDLDQHVYRILKYKQFVGLNEYKPIETKGLMRDLNLEADREICRQVANQALTIVRNNKLQIPLHAKDETLVIAIGDAKGSAWQSLLKAQGFKNYLEVNKNSTSSEWSALLKKLEKYTHIVISLHQPKIWSQQKAGFSEEDFKLIAKIAALKPATVVAFSTPYLLSYLPSNCNLIAGYEDEEEYQQAAAEILGGKRKAAGKLPVSLGLSTSPKPEISRPKNPYPTDELNKIDGVVQQLLLKKAAPGCRVLVLKDGYEVFNRSYGYLNYDKKQKVNDSSVYDLASITKVAATTLAVMKLAEQGLLDIHKTLGFYLPQAQGSNKANLVISDILQHRAGLTAWIPFYKETLPYIDSIFCKEEDSAFCVKVADKLFMLQANKDTIYKRIFDSPLESKVYRYSDLSMMLMQLVVEKISGRPLDVFVDSHFYRPMGLNSMSFNPWKKGNTKHIAPTQLDRLFRQQELCGYVHDPAAAMLGGVSGHAGLFSNASDLALLFQMLNDSGMYQGKRYLDAKTISTFTSVQRSDSRRGLGFDKTDLSGRASPASTLGSQAMFGHTGFTGTCVWADPKYNLVFVFLCNRICPIEENRELINGNYRTRIQDLVYQWVKTL